MKYLSDDPNEDETMRGFMKIWYEDIESIGTDNHQTISFWIWLNSRATLTPQNIVWCGKSRILQPGQILMASSNVPGMDRNRTRRALSRLQILNLVRADTARCGTIVTILNFKEKRLSHILDKPISDQNLTKEKPKYSQQASTLLELEHRTENRDIGQSSSNEEDCVNRGLLTPVELPKISPPDRTDYSGFVGAWDRNRGSLPQVRGLSEARKRKIKSRLKEEPELSYWESCFKRISNSPFCCGDNSHNWRASFDWIIRNEDNHRKVMEGNYDERIYKPKPLTVESIWGKQS